MSSRIISQNHTPGMSLLTKNVTKLVHPQGVDCSPFPWTFMGNPEDGGKSYLTAKNLLIYPIRKIPLNRFKFFAIKSFISSPIKQQFSINHPMQSSFVAAVISLVSYFKFQAYVHMCHANLTNKVYWMLPSAWEKHWMIEALPSKISFPSTFPFSPSLQCYFENPASIFACFPLFTLRFLFQTL